ncbi:hypothetical protein FHX49_001271 [Microbacterium endophyticum]|uniref:Uncharacterized protein n=1 Tax=Microbacterium endophyticum TaxID=1526412 RepID=A0A7W4V2W0_9MICO|nr:hypothetical protein [Microbacterium endophyticum]MBB2975704.1 hypothetical protein [Microbacterium endophyticum]NIK36187.1 hypothetical protein [Microbacterium endophyticum]
MTAPALTEQPLGSRNPRRISRAAILIAGVIVIPLALTVALNSYGALTVDSAIRMAFATVAGQTVAILSAATALVLTVKRRYALPAIAAMTLIAAFVTITAIANMADAGELLLTRLDTIADVDKLNR